MDTSGYYMTAELRIKDAAGIEETRKALIELCAVTRTEPGCRFFLLHQNLSDPKSLFLWECFDDEAAFKAHFEYPHTKAYFARGLTDVVQNFKTVAIDGDVPATLLQSSVNALPRRKQ